MSRIEISNRSAAFAVVTLTVVAAVLRAIELDTGLWYDEIVTLIESVRPPVRRIVTEFADLNNHPLYSLLAHFSVWLAGEHAWSLRLPAVIFGVVSVPMLYLLGTVVGRRLEAFLAASVLAVSYHHIWFSQNARGYTALLFWTMLATWLFLRIAREPRMSDAVAYGITAALGIYTHLTMGFVVASHALLWTAVLWTGRGRPDRRRHLTAAVTASAVGVIGSVLCYMPLLGEMSANFQQASPPTAIAAVVATPGWAVLEALKGLRIGLGAVGLIAAGAFAMLGIRDHWQRGFLFPAASVLPALITVTGVIAMESPMRPRFFFGLLGFALLFVVRGAFVAGEWLATFAWLPLRDDRAGVAIVGIIVLASLASLPNGYRYPKQDFDGAVQYMRAHHVDGEPVATAGLASYAMARYYRLPWFPVARAGDLDALRSNRHRVWLVYSFPEYMDRRLVEVVQRECEQQTTLVGTLGGGEVIVSTCDGLPPGATEVRY